MLGEGGVGAGRRALPDFASKHGPVTLSCLVLPSAARSQNLDLIWSADSQIDRRRHVRNPLLIIAGKYAKVPAGD